MTWKKEAAIYIVFSLFGILLLYTLVHVGTFLSEHVPARVSLEARG